MKITPIESYFTLTDNEIAKRAKLTPEEQKAVDAFMKAAKALPESICIDCSNDWPDDEDEPTLTVSKRITAGSCQKVAELRKPSLDF